MKALGSSKELYGEYREQMHKIADVKKLTGWKNYVLSVVNEFRVLSKKAGQKSGQVILEFQICVRIAIFMRCD